MEKRIYGQDADHPNIAGSLHHLGTVSEKKGILDAAEEWYKHSYEKKKRIYGSFAKHYLLTAGSTIYIL